LHPTAEIQRIGVDHDRLGALVQKDRKGRVDLAIGAGIQNFDLPPNG
jgi:hypothetical protein